MTFLILFLFFIWDRSLFLFNLNACMHVSEVFLSRLEHQSLFSHISQAFILISDYHAMDTLYTIGISNCLVSVLQFLHGNQSLSLSLCLSVRIMQLFSCHSGLLQQWLIIIGMWTVCIYLYAHLRNHKPHTHREREWDWERKTETERVREWKGSTKKMIQPPLVCMQTS